MNCVQCHTQTEPGELYCSNCRRVELVAAEAAKVAAIDPQPLCCPSCKCDNIIRDEPNGKAVCVDCRTVFSLQVGDGSAYYRLHVHLADEHGLTLLDSELYEVVRLARQCGMCECAKMAETKARCAAANGVLDVFISRRDGPVLRVGEVVYCPWCGRKVKGD